MKRLNPKLRILNRHTTMKQILTVSLLMLVTTAMLAQKNNSTYHSTDTSKTLDIREKLVRLALQNPTYEVTDRSVNKMLYELRKSRGSWLGAVGVSGNLNEFSIKQQQAGVANFYPRYNLSVNIPLDLFTTKSNDVKIARENYLIAEATRNEKYREIRALVLTIYEDVVMYKQKLESQIRITQDETIIYNTKERDFQDGIINQEEFTKYSKALEESKLLRGEHERNYKVAKIELERLIGMTLEEAMATK